MQSILDDFRGASIWDILAWHRVKASGIVFASLFSTWFIYVYFDYTMTTFLVRILTLVLMGTAALKVTSRIGSFESHDVAASMDKCYESIRPCVSKLTVATIDVITWRNFECSVKVFVSSIIVAYFGNWMSDSTLFLVCLLAAFTLPAVYERKKEQIDEVLAKVKVHTDKYLSIIRTKGEELEKTVESSMKRD